MSNNLRADMRATVIVALADGHGIREIERMTGVHRDTIMRLRNRAVKILATTKRGRRVSRGAVILYAAMEPNLP